MHFLAHCTGTALLLVLGVAIVRGLVLVDAHLHPCEVEIEPRRASKLVVDPGESFWTEGIYEIRRDGCSAIFYGSAEWHTLRGAVQDARVSPPSWPVDEKAAPREARRHRIMPVEAMPGTKWTHRLYAYWDAWGLWFGLSQVRVQYRDIVVEVRDQS